MRDGVIGLVILCVTLVAIPAAADVGWVAAHDLAPSDGLPCVAAGDLDGDGDQDLTSFAYYPIEVHWNTGTPEAPVWEVGTGHFGDIDEEYCPWRLGGLGDADGDGDLDAIISCWGESLRFYWSVGTPTAPAWEADHAQLAGVPMLGSTAHPCLADLDSDGDLDLAIMWASGLLGYAENTGSPLSPEWSYSGFVPGVGYASDSCPMCAFGDIDMDGDLDLVRVKDGSGPEAWENVGTPQAFEFVESSELLAGLADPPDRCLGVALFDVDADGDPDLLISGYLTGNFLYLNESFTAVDATSWTVIKALYRP